MTFFFGTAKIVQTVFKDRTKWMLAAKNMKNDSRTHFSIRFVVGSSNREIFFSLLVTKYIFKDF